MQYSLGIDAGGTYTDAVIIRDSDGEVVDSNKSFTTYPNPLGGIKNVLDSLDKQYLKNVSLVSVSTTLSTNSLLEGTGDPVGLILVGDHPVEKEFPTKDAILVSGGHDHNGEEVSPLDIDAVREFVLSTKNEVAAYAVSANFGIRNPEHELRTKELIRQLTSMPVVCGHELSQELGAYERAVTAFLNASLIPITTTFVNSVISDIRRRGIEARMLILRCDGSVANVEDALNKPIETIFSGPAASLLGASHLSGRKTCAVIDVGGTSTDLLSIHDGVPKISSSGAVVGGWKTRVKAIKMETSAMGGDSHVWVKGETAYIGPRRVMPLCVASVNYDGFLEKLRHNRMISRNDLNENFQQTRFFVKTGYKARGLNDSEKEVLNIIDNEPASINDISRMLKRPPSVFTLDSLIQKRLVQAIGFTPTDALHVRGDYNAWDSEAANIGAEMLSRVSRMGKYEFCDHIKEKVTKNIALNLLSFILPNTPESAIENILNEEYPVKFKVEIPVVMIGGPVRSYVDELGEVIEAEIIVPDLADVGNAIGALVGKGIKRVEINIRPFSLTSPENDFLVFSPVGRQRFEKYLEALDFATDLGKRIVKDHVSKCGIPESQIQVTMSKKMVSPEGWAHPPMETKLVIVGVGTPLLALK
ncbi:hydantoinase/oxoprolinase N-terminal domain-containing protein [Methanococcoides sp. FTZ1]|uniref:hydantoinase/oxoprolinase N-terminal domain-containing protein n=1 Tax=Methanococcoides sp. FTZ1 TaxID=3439061 RepID=UPI003F833BB6